ncbi:MAG TPA: dickkopf-related protein, partial [Anaeromyxobacter sp.]
MKRILFVFSIAVALACGSVNDKQGCSVSTECPVGQYCATAGGESKCWPDPVLPTASAVSASCTPGPCLRDSVLHVQATVTDDKEVLDASVSLDLDSARSFPMAKSGPIWVADVPLRALPFDAFTKDVVATVIGRDGARNSSAPKSGAGVTVTRLKWTYNAAAPLTSPAVMSDGTAVVGVSAAADQVLAISASGTKAWSRTLGTAAAVVTAAPAVGQFAIWVGSEDGKVYAVALDGSAANSGVDLTAAVKGSVAVLGAGAKEWCFATVTSVSGTGFIGTASSQGESAISSAPAQEGFTTGPIVATDDRIHAPTANSTNSATLRTFELSTAPVSLTGTWTASIGKKFGAAIAMDGSG